MHSYVRLLGAGTVDGGGPAILLFFDEQRYLFNCGEGTQRFCSQHGIKLSKLSSIFLTSLEWSRAGGVPGMICTLADYGGGGIGGSSNGNANANANAKFTLNGPTNTCHFIASLRAFLKRSNFQVSVNEATITTGIGAEMETIFADENITVRSLNLEGEEEEEQAERKRACRDASTNSKQTNHPHNPLSNHLYSTSSQLLLGMFKEPQNCPKKKEESALEEEESKQSDKNNSLQQADSWDRMQSVSPNNSTLCLAIEGPMVAGKFDAHKAKALGVPFGPLNGRLARGQTITLDDGRIVRPEECVSPSMAGSIFLILDVPTIAHARNLSQNIDRLLNDRVTLVFHCISASLFASSEYRKGVLERLPSRITQVLVTSDRATLVYPSKAMMQMKLAGEIDHEIFPIPWYREREKIGEEQIKSILERSNDQNYTINLSSTPSTTVINGTLLEGEPLMVFRWYPPGKYQMLDETETTRLKEEINNLDLFNWGQAKIADLEEKATPNDPIIVFLGTAAALPGKYRNVSATLVDFGNACFLFDCGEATYGQLLRMFGPVKCAELMARLKGIFLSHMHADHHLGFVGILHRMQKPFCLVAPSRYSLFLQEYTECVGLPQLFTFMAAELLVAEGGAIHQANCAKAMGLCRVEAIPVIHCHHSYGFVIRISDGVQVVYSGDTRPCPALAKAGQDGTAILIHEASFDDELIEEAMEKRHSTISEAISIGLLMQAEYTLLTHISQRYAKNIPPYNWDGTRRVIPVLDLMQLKLSKLRTLDTHAMLHQMIACMPTDGDDDGDNGKGS